MILPYQNVDLAGGAPTLKSPPALGQDPLMALMAIKWLPKNGWNAMMSS
ncbi:hypothetical protein A2U01_0061938 [Trifolium medium]|uniref:Uncharacterized protein n=1 Tax=Trifolium medium TaxID=97028 RepID=A0A392RYL0_9FABA|nr:hypothetical protein [Trifolium medium]